MKKIIRLTESDLTKIIKRVINEESTVPKSVVAIYNQIVEAVGGWGTDPDAVLSAIKRLKNQEEFNHLLKLFKNKATGYSDFYQMVNEEYEMDNAKDVVNLIFALRNLNITATADFATNRVGSSLFMGGFKYTGVVNKDYNPKQPSDMTSCKTLWSSRLPVAIKWWRDWLSDPITKKKFLSNYINKPYVVSFYSKYFELLRKIKLNYYDKTMLKINGIETSPGAYAFVTEPDGNVYVNCSYNLTQEDVEGILVHEIQHMIYDILPLNPSEKISSVFAKNTPKKSKEQIKSEFLKTPDKTGAYSSQIIAAAKKLSVEPEYISSIKQSLDSVLKQTDDPGYICRETEKMSNINGIRKVFGVKPGQNITLDMIRPYITMDKWNVDVSWLLYCWAQKGFPDINQMLQKINQLALKQNTKSPQNPRA